MSAVCGSIAVLALSMVVRTRSVWINLALFALLLGINKTRGTTLVLVTHDAELAAVADMSIALKDGRVLQPALPAG